MPLSSRQLRALARKIRLLLMDVDGVLTDGVIYYHPQPRGGFYETKGFHSRDGLGIRLAHQAGLRTGIISGRGSPVVTQRAKELGIHFIEQDALEKLSPYERVLGAANLRDEEVCYIGDDVVDLPVLKRVGLAVTVADGHKSLRRHVHYQTEQDGGQGAVRETIELILSAQGKWEAIFEHYLSGRPLAVGAG